MRNRRFLAGMVLWLAAVVTVAGLAWFAIDSAGRQVTTLPLAETGTGQPDGSSTTDDTTIDLGTPPPDTGSAGATGTPSPDGSASPTASPTDRPSSRPAPKKTRHPARTTRPHQPRPTTTTSRPAQPVSGSRTTRGGRLKATCRGATLDDYQAVPHDDWSASVQRKGSGVAEAKFTQDKDEVDVEVSCGTGRPVFTVRDRETHDSVSD